MKKPSEMGGFIVVYARKPHPYNLSEFRARGGRGRPATAPRDLSPPSLGTLCQSKARKPTVNVRFGGRCGCEAVCLGGTHPVGAGRGRRCGRGEAQAVCGGRRWGFGAQARRRAQAGNVAACTGGGAFPRQAGAAADTGAVGAQGAAFGAEAGAGGRWAARRARNAGKRRGARRTAGGERAGRAARGGYLRRITARLV